VSEARRWWGPVPAAWRALRAEGPRGVWDRVIDRAEERRRRLSFGAELPVPAGGIPVLEVLSTPPLPRLGGLQLQLLARLDREIPSRPAALLYPRADGYRLEVLADGRRGATSLPGLPNGAPPSPVALDDAAFEAAVARAADLVGARALHVEGLAGLPLGSLLALEAGTGAGAGGRPGLRLRLAVHDFSLYCPRPHLLEEPAVAFCGFSRDPARCARCLGATWPVGRELQADRRALARRLLAAADAVTYPSEYLLAAHRTLFPGLIDARHQVRPPEHREQPLVPPSHAAPPRRVAFVGRALPHKGSLVFEELVDRLAGTDLTWTVYGDGDAALLRRLRGRDRVRVRGHYRAGALPGLLRRDRIDLALLLSVVPESYSLTLSECWEAGVPVLAFDHGAPADRIRRLGGGLLVDPAAGAGGVAALLAELAHRNEGAHPLPAHPDRVQPIETAAVVP
jgi:glycosyltransferase involved in cell wall biosynthesis